MMMVTDLNNAHKKTKLTEFCIKYYLDAKRSRSFDIRWCHFSGVV